MSFNISLFAGIAFRVVSAYYNNRNHGLNKKVASVANEHWQKKFEINLMYAQEALRYTAQVLPEEAVNYSVDQVVTYETLQKITKQRQEVEDIIEKEEFYVTEDNLIEIVSTVAKKYKIGNCGERSSVAYTFLKNEKNLRKVDRLTLENGDHAFVVIGRDPLSDVRDPSSSGKSAVVCEPWGKRYFPAEQLFDQLNKISERTLYDPNVQSIGWIKSGNVPLDVTIYKWIRLNQKSDKEFAKKTLAKIGESSCDKEKMIKLFLMDYLDRKSKPKIAPLLSKKDQKTVKNIYLQHLSEKRQ